MRVTLHSKLSCRAELAWDEVQKASLLREVAWPLLTFRPLPNETLPEHWEQQGTVNCRLFLFGLVPLGRHEIHFERIDGAAREIKTRERNALVARWDHLIRIRATPDATCIYSDELTIEAGWRTRLVWLFAQFFYRHRQRRWAVVARRISAQTVIAGDLPTAEHRPDTSVPAHDDLSHQLRVR